MKLFKKEPTDMADNGDNSKQRAQRSRFLMQIDHYNAIEKHIGALQNLNSMENFDLQKAADFFRYRRESATSAVEEIGGGTDQSAVEEQIREFIPKALHRDAQE